VSHPRSVNQSQWFNRRGLFNGENMTNRWATAPLSRRTALALAVGVAAASLSGPAFGQAAGARDPALETYVNDSVRAALAALYNPNSTVRARQAEFVRLMGQFSDVERLAINVLGRYGQAMRSDPARGRRWVETFRTYSMAVYEDQFRNFQADSFRVVGSRVNRPGADATVLCQILPRGARRPVAVDFRLLRGRDGVWRTLDIRTVFDGNEVWLSERQTADFLTAIERNNRNLDAFINDVATLTRQIQARVEARG
jgi:phospholipid transport system substrate-binding protein